MPVMLGITPPFAPIQSATTTAEEIVNRAGQEVRNVLDPANANDQVIFLDYINRIQLQMLRASRWQFQWSDVIYFSTERGQTDYYIGPVGQALPGQVDTLLDLNDVDFILRNSVFDITNNRTLFKKDERPYSSALSFQDGQFRTGRPLAWRNDLLQPNVIQLYPASDNQNSYRPVPQTPYVSQSASATVLADRTYFTVVTLLDSFGNESVPCAREAWTKVEAGNVITVHSPFLPYNITSSDASYTQWNVYGGTVSGSWVKQNASPINIATDWTEPDAGLISGAAPPTVNNLIPMDGYLIGFRYFQQRQIVEELETVVQIPDVYKDIFCAGVTFLCCQYLRLHEDAARWYAQYKDGIRDMIRDRNSGPREQDYISPDNTTVGMGASINYTDPFYR